MCRATVYDQQNIAGCTALLLSWAYYHIPALRPGGYVSRRFPLAARWSGYQQRNDSLGSRIRQWRRVLNNLGSFGVSLVLVIG
ncbi:hypothetical protein PIB30_070363 [Stylosanthes scabra]|uniref:Uncharacterized protein n=1 Tax=Stylosanthes scabra TaxID=79078 RepID=A0ABU6RNN8_9FABA|nr:hypothetical protein [Stylosanthes scabra]